MTEAARKESKLSLVTPRTPSGVMELLPREQVAFQKFMDTIRRSYEKYGFLPIETPVFELSSVLLTKSGGETEKQVYFVQSTGALASGQAPELALHFDLTVPLARYVAQHEAALNFPFRRYQMQKVYRGERPQKGREREFYQCDIDIIGRDDLAPGYDAELVAVIHEIFSSLHVGAFVVQLNNRKLLRGLLEGFGLHTPETQTLALREIDKLDKIGVDKVRTSLTAPEVGMDGEGADKLLELLTRADSNVAALQALAECGIDNETFRLGHMELKAVLAAALALGVPESAVRIKLSMVRGLDYYTGTVYETLLTEMPEFGSVCSGGRYENLAGLYTKSRLPGVGISIGATRLFAALLEAGRIQTDTRSSTNLIILQVDENLIGDYFQLAAQLRRDGLNVEVYVDPHKLGKQLKYADRAGIPYALLMGPDEKAKGVVTLRDMKSGEQEEVPTDELPTRLMGMKAA